MAYYPFNGGEGGLETNEPSKDLMKFLKDKTRTAGHMLTFKEAKNDPTMIDPNEYAKYYGGSFTEIATEAWSDVKAELFGEDEDDDAEEDSTEDDDVGDDDAEDDKMEEVRKREDANDGKHQETHKVSKRKFYTPEKIKEILRAFYEKNQRFPTQTEANSSEGLPSYAILFHTIGRKTEWEKFVFGDDDPLAPNQEVEAAEAAEVTEAAEAAEVTEVAEVTEEAEVTEAAGKAEVSPIDVVIENDSNKPIDIELKITLPDRKNPIVMHLSF